MLFGHYDLRILPTLKIKVKIKKNKIIQKVPERFVEFLMEENKLLSFLELSPA